MPEICKFYGIKIFMNYSEHDPPHFHAEYGEYQIIVYLNNWLIEGKFPKRALKMVLKWGKKNKDSIMKDWNLAREHKELQKIEPLI